jgi:hypothetical protein
VLGLFAALSAFGCSDSGDGGGGTGGTSSGTGGAGSGTGGTSSGTGTRKVGMDTTVASTSASNACCLLCVKEDPCKSGTTVDDCALPTGYRKCGQYDGVTTACDAAVKAYFDCLRNQADVCGLPDPACDAKQTAAATACG